MKSQNLILLANQSELPNGIKIKVTKIFNNDAYEDLSDYILGKELTLKDGVFISEKQLWPLEIYSFKSTEECGIVFFHIEYKILN